MRARAHARGGDRVPTLKERSRASAHTRTRAYASVVGHPCTSGPTHACSRACVQTRRHTNARPMRDYTHQRIPTHVRMRARSHAGACVCVPDLKERVCAFARACTRACVSAVVHPCTSGPTHACSRACLQARRHTSAHPCANTRISVYPHMCACAPAHMRTRVSAYPI